jgi:hypothetical protein
MKAITQPMDVKQRKGEEKTVVGTDSPTVQQIDSIRGEVVLGQNSSLGRARSARGINDSDGCVSIGGGPCWYILLCRYVARQIGSCPYRDLRCDWLIGHNPSRFCIAQNVRDLSIAIKNIDRNKNDSRFYTGQIDVDHLNTIRQVDTESITRIEPVAEQPVHHAIASRVNIAERVRLILEFQSYGVSSPLQRGIE